MRIRSSCGSNAVSTCQERIAAPCRNYTAGPVAPAEQVTCSLCITMWQSPTRPSIRDSTMPMTIPLDIFRSAGLSSFVCIPVHIQFIFLHETNKLRSRYGPSLLNNTSLQPNVGQVLSYANVTVCLKLKWPIERRPEIMVNSLHRQCARQ
jgi:hypothetical protein